MAPARGAAGRGRHPEAGLTDRSSRSRRFHVEMPLAPGHAQVAGGLTVVGDPQATGGGRWKEPNSPFAAATGSSNDAEPEVRRSRRVGQADAFELDVGSAWAVEQPDAVTEQDGRDEHEDLVEHTRVEALLGGVGAEDVDVLVSRGGLGRGDAAVEITDEGDTRHRGVRGVMGEDELWSGPPPAERLAFVGRAPVRIVAAEGAAADEKCADLADELVQRHGGRIQHLPHDLPPSLRRARWLAPVETAGRGRTHRCVGGNAVGRANAGNRRGSWKAVSSTMRSSSIRTTEIAKAW